MQYLFGSRRACLFFLPFFHQWFAHKQTSKFQNVLQFSTLYSGRTEWRTMRGDERVYHKQLQVASDSTTREKVLQDDSLVVLHCFLRLWSCYIGSKTKIQVTPTSARRCDESARQSCCFSLKFMSVWRIGFFGTDHLKNCSQQLNTHVWHPTRFWRWNKWDLRKSANIYSWYKCC